MNNILNEVATLDFKIKLSVYWTVVISEFLSPIKPVL